MSISVGGCAGSAPFSVPGPELAALEQEEPLLYAAPEAARDALAGSELPRLDQRIDNLFTVYEAELARAQRAQGGLLNTVLTASMLALPLAGTVSAFTLSDPDDVETVAIVTSSATTLLVLANTVFQPRVRVRKAAGCAAYLRSALESLNQRWDRENLRAVQGTPDEWQTYLAVRSSLDAGRRTACE